MVLRQRLNYLLEKNDDQAILMAKEQELERPGGSYVNPGSTHPLESISPDSGPGLLLFWFKCYFVNGSRKRSGNMNRAESKIREVHLHRKVCIYVRQSNLAQVHEHQESTKRQYELYQRAHQLGWVVV